MFILSILLSFNIYADPTQEGVNQEALNNTMQLLNSQHQRNEYYKENPEAKKAEDMMDQIFTDENQKKTSL